MKRITRSDLLLNQPLPWALYDQNGKLLLQAGFVLSVPRYIDALLERGAYYDESIPPVDYAARNRGRTNPLPAKIVASGSPVVAEIPRAAREPAFSRAESINLNIRRIHKLAQEIQHRISLDEYVRAQARLLIEAVDEDPDSTIAAGHVNRQPRDFRPNHQFLGAALAAVLGPALGIVGGERESLVCAALTRDVGILHLDALLAGTDEDGMSDFLRRSLEEHPQNSVAILRERGVDDASWLGFVVDHHERLQGGGYPARKTAGELSCGARLLALCDAYASQVTPSERRKGIFAANAIRQLFLEKCTHYDEKLVALLYKFLTKHPPGSLVALANGEVAVIKNRPHGERPLQVSSVYDRHGMPRFQPAVRDTGNPEFAITGVVAAEQCRSAELIMKRLWLKP